MKQQLERRLEVLRKEFETGQAKLQEVVRQEQSLRETLLRISGAIQVLEEELGTQGGGHESAAEVHTGGLVSPNGGSGS